MVILTVTQINTYVKSVLEYDRKLKNIFLTGEISNYRAHYSGHMYFTLKDEQSEIRAVMFKNRAMRLRFLPENGMKVLIRGSIAVYDSKGQYQVLCDDMQPDGLGSLAIAFEQLKSRLSDEGLFDSEKKKPIPAFPEKIGVVTAPTGAAVEDIFSILNRRFPVAEIVFVPVAVQGAAASYQISEAVDLLSESDCDVIIVGRGGGSIEDLWGFNEERVARSIYNCKVPVISAVGHETDYTISDFTADLRAATPSAAAELCSPDIKDIAYTVDALLEGIRTKVESFLSDSERYTLSVMESISRCSPESRVISGLSEVINTEDRIRARMQSLVDSMDNDLRFTVERIDMLNPSKILSKGYSIAKDKKGNIIKSALSLNSGDSFTLCFSDGNADCTVN